ncbi:MAG TPA: glycosyltransferase family 39 protein, partial [Myxococcota bacterium]|nr:glycosyltransferase family 39 protein [Myxococcota bacterium]
MSPDKQRFLGLGAGLAALLTLLGTPKALVLDEESYLWLGKQVFEHGAYGWSRLWPPWDGDAFVYAHPPLFLYWVAFWEQWTELVPLLRLGVGLPWSLLLGASAAWLALRSTRHPELGLGLWICTPVVALGLQNSLMIDLPATALAALAVAAWREGAEEGRLHWFLLSGLALGLGLWTKYPVGLLLPVLGAHAWRQYRQRVGAGPWLGLALALALFAGMEAALYISYSKIHFIEVWLRRGEIPQGSWLGRAFGTLVRVGLLSLPIPFLQADRR